MRRGSGTLQPGLQAPLPGSCAGLRRAQIRSQKGCKLRLPDTVRRTGACWRRQWALLGGHVKDHHGSPRSRCSPRKPPPSAAAATGSIDCMLSDSSWASGGRSLQGLLLSIRQMPAGRLCMACRRTLCCPKRFWRLGAPLGGDLGPAPGWACQPKLAAGSSKIKGGRRGDVERQDGLERGRSNGREVLLGGWEGAKWPHPALRTS